MYLPHSHTMKLVYELRIELQRDPEQVARVQKLTLDKTRPHMGLKGVGGLWGSEEWWESTRNGTLRRDDVSGVITRTYFAGQDSRWGDEVNSFLLRLDDGSERSNSIYVNERRDAKLFKPGHRVAWAAVRDPLKNPRQALTDDGCSTTMLEMAVSLEPQT